MMYKKLYILITKKIQPFVKIAFLSFLISFSNGCEDSSYGSNSSSSGLTGCYYNGKSLYRGSQGGCYYINSNDNKTYVDRSECDC